MINDQDITLLIPAKKEKESLSFVLTELKKYDYKVLIVMEQNDLETYDVAKKFSYSIDFQINNRGYGSAIIQGLNKITTNYVCIFNADGSFNPNEITNMKKAMVDNFDFIFGSRYLNSGSGSDDDSFLTLIGNKFFTFLGNFLFKLNISDILYTYILGKTEKFKKLALNSSDFRLCVEIPIKAKANNNKISDISCYERKRYAGKKKVNEFRDGFYILFYIIKSIFKK
jgi:glycosyltransferase involved in cell wall biosynthesis